MAESKHTPGEWEPIFQNKKAFGVRTRDGYLFFSVQPSRYGDQDERYKDEVAEHIANLHLIAASPDMLEALMEAEWGGTAIGGNMSCPVCFNSREYGHSPDCKLAAAIAKAKRSTKQFQPGQCHECKKVQNGVMEIADGRKLCRDCFLALKTREAADAEAKGETDG